VDPLLDRSEISEQREADRLIGDFILYLSAGAIILLLLVPAVIGLVLFFLIYTLKRDWIAYTALITGCSVLLLQYAAGSLISYLGVFSVIEVPFIGHFLEKAVNEGHGFPVTSATFWNVTGLSLLSAFGFYIYATYFFKKKVTTRLDEIKKRKVSIRYQRFRRNRLQFLTKRQLSYRNQKTKETFVGYTEYQERLTLKPHEMNFHMLATGGTGTGKTTLIASLMESALQENKPVIFFDGKGERKSMLEFKALCEAYGKEVYLFSETEQLTYNPIKNGTPTETRDKLMSLFSFSNEGDGAYYTDIASRYLQLIIKLIDESGATRDLPTITRLTNLKHIQAFIRNQTYEKEVQEETITEVAASTDTQELDDFLGTPQKDSEKKTVKEMRTVSVSLLADGVKRIKDTLESEFPKEIVEGCLTRLRMQLGELIESDLGGLFLEREDGIDLRKITEENNVVIFSISGSRYADYIKRIGKLVILDVNSLVAYRQERGRRAIFAVYDEFSAYGDRRMVDIVNKSRSAGFECIISTQTLSDIDSVDPVMTEQIISNCNIIATGRVNSAKDAERIAEVFGTYPDQEVTQQIERRHNRSRVEAEMGTIRDVERFKANPREIKNLQIGEIFINRKMIEEGLGDTYFRRVYVRNALDLGGL
jgi:GTPase SAR1 family protein